MRFAPVLLLLCAGCASGVATGATQGRRAVLPLTSLRARTSQAVDHEGVGVAAGLITWDSARRYKDAMVIVHWLEGNERYATSHVGVGNQGHLSERWGEVPILPMPTFMVGIANRTDKPLRIEPSRFVLVDGRGQTYAPIADLGAITGRVEEQLIASYRGLVNADAVRNGLVEKLGTLPFLTRAVEVAPGADWVGYVPFQVSNVGPAEWARFARSGGLVLRFTDERGTVPLSFDPFEAKLQVTCPDDEKATLERCAPGGAMPKPSAFGP